MGEIVCTPVQRKTDRHSCLLERYGPEGNLKCAGLAERYGVFKPQLSKSLPAVHKHLPHLCFTRFPAAPSTTYQTVQKTLTYLQS